MSKSYICLVDRTQSDATTPSQRKPGSDGSEEVLRIPLVQLARATSLQMGKTLPTSVLDMILNNLVVRLQ